LNNYIFIFILTHLFTCTVKQTLLKLIIYLNVPLCMISAW